jgi:cell division septal protein FtsQ
MANRERHTQKKPRRPRPEFWIKLGLTATLLLQFLPAWLALSLGLVVLVLPASLFRP